MAEIYCSNCGTRGVPGGSFCASCGHQLTVGGQTSGALAFPPPPASTWSSAPPQEPWTAPPVQPWSGPPPGTPWTDSQYAQSPWAGGAAPPTTAPRTALLDALLKGDWRAPLKAAALAIATMAVLALLGVLLLSQGELGSGDVLALSAAAMCLAVGGDAYVEAGAAAFSTEASTSASVGLLPLTITLVGLAMLARSYRRQLRTHPPATPADGLLAAVRTSLAFAVPFLPLSLLTRRQAGEFDPLGFYGRFGVGVLSTVLGALLFAVAALGLTWLLSRWVPLTGRLGAVRDRARAPLGGALAVFSLGVLAVVVSVIWSMVEEGEVLASLGVAMLGAGNGALAAVLLSAGVPLSLEGDTDGPFLGGYLPGGSSSVDLFTLTGANGWLWVAPVVLVVVTLAVATALAVRQDTVVDARREAARFAGAMAAVAFAAALLLRISADGGGEISEFSASGSGSVTFNPFLAALVLALWGGVAGLLAPVIAARVPFGFVTGVRRRFGSASGSVPPA